jgi:hypothetical protein
MSDAPERPRAPRASGRRAPTAPAKIPSGPPVGKIAPYVTAAAVVGGLVFLLRSPRFAALGAMGIVLVIMGALGYFAVTGRVNLPTEDRTRTILPMVTVLAMAFSAVPFAFTLFPPQPTGEIALASPGAQATVHLGGPALSVWVTAQGRFVPTAEGTATYYLRVSRNGGAGEGVDGVFSPHAGGPLPDRHLLSLRGEGEYTIRLEQASSAVAMPLRIALSGRPFSLWLLVMLYAAIGVVALAVDTMLWRRGIEPAVAACCALPMAAAAYFQMHPPTESLPQSLLAAGLVGVVGAIGAELLARVVRMVAGK